MSDETEDWYGPDTATFGDRVAGAREAANLSQAQLARYLGVRKSTLAGWEDDASEPRANKLSMMAGVLNVSITWLLTGEGEGMPSPPAEDGEPAVADLMAVLSELRDLRTALRANADRAARLEKRLRQALRTEDVA